MHTDIWLEREDLGTSLLLCPGKMFSQENWNAFSLLWHIQHYVFEAPNLLLIILLYLCSRNSATWQWHSGPLSSKKKSGKEGDCKSNSITYSVVIKSQRRYLKYKRRQTIEWRAMLGKSVPCILYAPVSRIRKLLSELLDSLKNLCRLS